MPTTPRRAAPQTRRPLYAEEMWELYQANELTPETKLGGTYAPPKEAVDTREVLTLIAEAGDDERARRKARGEEVDGEEEFDPPPRPLRRVVDLAKEAAPARKAKGRGRAAPKKAAARPKRRGRTKPREKPSGASSRAPDSSRSMLRRGILVISHRSSTEMPRSLR